MNWLPIPGFENYEVSDSGDVRNGDKMLGWVCTNPNDGYKSVRVGLTKNGIRSYHTVARLIAKAFIPNPENKPQVDHIDRNSLNNHVSNLRWATEHEQIMNRDMPLGASGHRYIRKIGNKWRVKIMRHGQYVLCKYFDTFEEAEDERDDFLLTEWLVKQVDQGLL